MSKLHDRIKELLAASAPCTFIEIVAEVSNQTDIPRQKVLPEVIQAIADLTATGEMQEYEQKPLDNALDYAWQLSDEAMERFQNRLEDRTINGKHDCDTAYDSWKDDQLTD